MRRRKRESKTIGIRDCASLSGRQGLWIVELKDFSEAAGRTITLWQAQRIMINKIASSMIEKAQGSMEPKAVGVKIRRKMMRSLMRVLIIAQSLVYCGVI
jgi:hypothetical protein